jgi:hypothetical protein
MLDRLVVTASRNNCASLPSNMLRRITQTLCKAVHPMLEAVVSLEAEEDKIRDDEAKKIYLPGVFKRWKTVYTTGPWDLT